MKNILKSVTAIVLALALPTATAFAKGNNSHILSDSAWQEIEEAVEVENKLLLEEIVLEKTSAANTMHLDFLPGSYTNLILSAPLEPNQEVGVVVFDAQGELVHSAAGTFAEMQNLRFLDYFDWDMNYIIKVYSETEVFEAKVQVVYR